MYSTKIIRFGKLFLWMAIAAMLLMTMQFFIGDKDNSQRTARHEIISHVWLELSLLHDDYELLLQELAEYGFNTELHAGPAERIKSKAVALEVYCQEHPGTLPRKLFDELKITVEIYSDYLDRLVTGQELFSRSQLDSELLIYRLWFHKVSTQLAELFKQ